MVRAGLTYLLYCLDITLINVKSRRDIFTLSNVKNISDIYTLDITLSNGKKMSDIFKLWFRHYIL